MERLGAAWLLVAVVGLSLHPNQIQASRPIVDSLEASPVVIEDENFIVTAKVIWAAGDYRPDDVAFYQARIKDKTYIGEFAILTKELLLNQEFSFSLEGQSAGTRRVFVKVADTKEGLDDAAEMDNIRIQVIPGPVTLIPPLVTIFIAIWTKNVLASLLTGVYLSVFLINEYNPFTAFLRVFDTVLVDSLADAGHVNVIFFTWLLSGMVACILRAGGGAGLVKLFEKYAKSARAGSLVTMALGLLIFFDGLANTLIVGQTMRPITDQLLISREKLAFLVDATSAPVTSISPVSTWIGFEVSLIDSVLTKLTAQGEDMSCYDSSAFVVFLQTIPGRYYPFLMIALQLLLVLTCREFGPMLAAERRMRRPKSSKPVAHNDSGGYEIESSFPSSPNTINDSKDELAAMNEVLDPKPGYPHRWWTAAIPITSTIVVVILALIFSGISRCEDLGVEKTAENIFGNANSYAALMYASVVGTIVIWFLALIQRVDEEGNPVSICASGSKPIMTLGESLETWMFGVKTLTEAVFILLLAWALGEAFSNCGTGPYISSALQNSVHPEAYPVLTFIISAVLAVVIGSSWGTMGIMFPLILPAAHAADPCNKDVFYGTISAILSGAVFGDHCSPISDTTILSAVACRCDLIAHVRTQVPYALVVGTIAILAGEIPAGYGVWPAWAGLLVGLAAVVLVVLFIAVPVDSDSVDIITRVAHFFSNRSSNSASTASMAGERMPLVDRANPRKDAHLYDPYATESTA